MITLEKLHKVYTQSKREVVALDGVDLHVPAGEIHGVVGPSGSGKSTLLRCVNLLERPTSGRVYVDKTDVTAASGAQLRAERRRIGMVFQQFNLLDSRTAADNVAHPLEIAGMGRRERAARVAELLDLVGLGDRASAYPAQLSGGQKQRVGIARALASGPSVLLSDEATSALDPETTASVLRLLRQLAGDLGLTVLLITHEMSVVKQLCDSASLLREGRIVDSGRLADLVSDPDSELARGLLPDLPPALAVPGLTSVDITVTGSNADRPLVAELSRAVELDATILGAAIETVAGRRVGRMHLGLPTDHPRYADAIRYLDTQGLRPEAVTA